jgi:hypothetical protein
MIRLKKNNWTIYKYPRSALSKILNPNRITLNISLKSIQFNLRFLKLLINKSKITPLNRVKSMPTMNHKDRSPCYGTMLLFLNNVLISSIGIPCGNRVLICLSQLLWKNKSNSRGYSKSTDRITLKLFIRWSWSSIWLKRWRKCSLTNTFSQKYRKYCKMLNASFLLWIMRRWSGAWISISSDLSIPLVTNN